MRTLSLLLIVLVVCACASASAETYKIDWYVISSGGGDSAGTGFKRSATVGQPAAGSVSGTNLLHTIGFWVGDAETPVVVANIADAKLLPDGTLVSIAGRIATSAIGDFSGFFYVEDPGRSSGIRVAMDPSSVGGLARGSVVNVIGTMGTASNSERQIAGPMVIITSTAAPLVPVGMNNRTLGGADLGTPPLGQYGIPGATGVNNVGLLVRCWGRVVARGPGCVVIDDGGGSVRVDTSVLASQPAQDTYIGVIGVSSIYNPADDRFRLLLPRGDTDILPY